MTLLVLINNVDWMTSTMIGAVVLIINYVGLYYF